MKHATAEFYFYRHRLLARLLQLAACDGEGSSDKTPVRAGEHNPPCLPACLLQDQASAGVSLLASSSSSLLIFLIRTRNCVP